MAEPVYRRVLLKLSGEVLAGDQGFGIDPAKASYLANEVKSIHELGVGIGLIIGAGNIFRGMQAASKGMDRVTGDYLGMLATIMNAISVQDALEKVGCERIQIDEPVLTEAPAECTWAADVINDIVDSFPNLHFSLHICGGNAHRKRGYFGKYTEMIDGLKKLKVHELHLEHCTLHYDMLEIFNHYDFKGILSFGVIDQRTDELESTELVQERIKPVLERFGKDRILLSSECGFGHVPIDITRAKLGKLVEVSKKY